MPHLLSFGKMLKCQKSFRLIKKYKKMRIRWKRMKKKLYLQMKKWRETKLKLEVCLVDREKWQVHKITVHLYGLLRVSHKAMLVHHLYLRRILKRTHHYQDEASLIRIKISQKEVLWSFWESIPQIIKLLVLHLD